MGSSTIHSCVENGDKHQLTNQSINPSICTYSVGCQKSDLTNYKHASKTNYLNIAIHVSIFIFVTTNDSY